MGLQVWWSTLDAVDRGLRSRVDPDELARADAYDRPADAARSLLGAALLRVAGWCTNHKRVERIWRDEGLKVPPRQPKRGRLWLNDGACVRLRPERPNHVWSYAFVEDRTRDGRKFRMLCVVDEETV